MKSEKRKREKGKKEKKIIFAMASRRRAMKELGRVTFSPDTTSSGGSPRDSLRSLPKKLLHLNSRRGSEKILNKTHIYNECTRKNIITAKSKREKR